MAGTDEQLVLGIAKALFMDRLHLLTLTEVVRLRISADEDGLLRLPPELDEQMRQQAFDFVLRHIPASYHVALFEARRGWFDMH